MNEDAAFFSEAYMLSKTGYKYEMGGIEKVDGKDAYAINVNTPAGRTFTAFYDVASGLKVKNSSTEEGGPQGKVIVQTYFSDYKAFNGVQIPTKVLVDQGPLKIEMNFNDIKVNSGLKAEEIK